MASEASLLSYHFIEGAESATAAWAASAGAYKLRSWLALHRMGLPSLKGVILFGTDREGISEAVRFAEASGRGSLLLRSDKVGETGRYPRGGYLVQAEGIAQEVNSFVRRGRIVYLLEPFSPFDDLYSCVVAYRPDEPVLLEVVGPGFDASDIKRGDISPHERILLLSSVATRPVVLSRTIVGRDEYVASWTARASKVGGLLRGTPSSPDVSTLSVEESLRELQRRGDTLLLEHSEEYVPMPDRLLGRLWEDTRKTELDVRSLGLPGEPFIVSMSFVGRWAARVYWDIVWPHLKYRFV